MSLLNLDSKFSQLYFAAARSMPDILRATSQRQAVLDAKATFSRRLYTALRGDAVPENANLASITSPCIGERFAWTSSTV